MGSAAPAADSPGTAARRWAEDLARWAIPAEVRAAAPDDPWSCPPSLFRADPAGVDDRRPSHRLARAALGQGGTVLDVGCGGGAATVALLGAASEVTGVDASAAMLEQYAAMAAAAGCPHREVEGRWPDVAPEVEAADVVVCHHVAYNVADIVPFLAALDAHARRMVVMEVTAVHPQAALNPLWLEFWGLRRPDQPTADTLVQVLGDAGYRPWVHRFSGPPRRPAALGDRVAFARRQLCLTPDRDAEVAAALAAHDAGERQYVALAWRAGRADCPRRRTVRR